MSKKNKIKITQIKSVIGYRIQARATLDALGLKKMNQYVIHNDTPATINCNFNELDWP